MYLHEIPREPATQLPIERGPLPTTTAWMGPAMFWMGMASSIIAGVIVAKLTK